MISTCAAGAGHRWTPTRGATTAPTNKNELSNGTGPPSSRPAESCCSTGWWPASTATGGRSMSDPNVPPRSGSPTTGPNPLEAGMLTWWRGAAARPYPGDWHVRCARCGTHLAQGRDLPDTLRLAQRLAETLPCCDAWSTTKTETTEET